MIEDAIAIRYTLHHYFVLLFHMSEGMGQFQEG